MDIQQQEAGANVLPDPLTDKRYPRLSAYLSALPQGLASYPECQAKTSLSLTLLGGMPVPRPNPRELPEPLASFLHRPPTSMWTSEVEARALALSIADHYHMTDSEYLSWVKAQNRSYFGSLMYRAVMAFVSPASLIPKAGTRWAAVHRGSILTARTVAPGEVSATLTFPPHLFAGLALLQVTVVFEAVLENANARSPKVSLVAATPTSGTYQVHWYT